MNGTCVMNATSLRRQFLHFTSAGAVGTLAHYATLIALASGFGVAAAWAAMVGAGVGAGVNYVLNRNFTFRSARRHGEALPRFLGLAALGIALNGAIVGGLVRLGSAYLIAQVVATLLILGINFIVSRKWIFPKTR